MWRIIKLYTNRFPAFSVCKIFPILCLFILSFSNVNAADIRVAVASNFATTLKQIAHQFEAKTGHKVLLSIGSTGKHYAQIKHGAPFDIFLAADAKRPKLLAKQGLIVEKQIYPYALGQLALWTVNEAILATQLKEIKQLFATKIIKHLAIANPKLAPYGKAAQDVLKVLKLWSKLKKRALGITMVRGENIGQTFQFVKSGNADLGFVAYSQIKSLNPMHGSYYLLPNHWYEPIAQYAVLLKASPQAHEFWSFLKSAEVERIIKDAGYALPGVKS